MKVIVWGIVTALMFTTVVAAQEDAEGANFLLPYCKISPGQAGNKAFLVGRCVGLVQGVADALSLAKEANAKEANGEKLNPLCLNRPKGASTDQAVKAVVKYGDAHPEQTHAPFTVVAALALTEAWPCRK